MENLLDIVEKFLSQSDEKLEELARGSLRKAAKDGDVENGSLMAGQIAGMVSKEQSCEEIIQELVSKYEESIGICRRAYE